MQREPPAPSRSTRRVSDEDRQRRPAIHRVCSSENGRAQVLFRCPGSARGAIVSRVPGVHPSEVEGGEKRQLRRSRCAKVFRVRQYTCP
eukprot:3089938-Alexandrium_andersonii.AAC.1